jgi:type IV pilus biogenesis protein CpaD/CtpE
MRWIRSLLLAVVTASFAGCAMFQKETWDLSRYRDERAVDIDQRLSEDVPIGKNPF